MDSPGRQVVDDDSFYDATAGGSASRSLVSDDHDDDNLAAANTQVSNPNPHPPQPNADPSCFPSSVIISTTPTTTPLKSSSSSSSTTTPTPNAARTPYGIVVMGHAHPQSRTIRIPDDDDNDDDDDSSHHNIDFSNPQLSPLAPPPVGSPPLAPPSPSVAATTATTPGGVTVSSLRSKRTITLGGLGLAMPSSTPSDNHTDTDPDPERYQPETSVPRPSNYMLHDGHHPSTNNNRSPEQAHPYPQQPQQQPRPYPFHQKQQEFLLQDCLQHPSATTKTQQQQDQEQQFSYDSTTPSKSFLSTPLRNPDPTTVVMMMHNGTTAVPSAAATSSSSPQGTDPGDSSTSHSDDDDDDDDDERNNPFAARYLPRQDSISSHQSSISRLSVIDVNYSNSMAYNDGGGGSGGNHAENKSLLNNINNNSSNHSKPWNAFVPQFIKQSQNDIGDSIRHQVQANFYNYPQPSPNPGESTTGNSRGGFVVHYDDKDENPTTTARRNRSWAHASGGSGGGDSTILPNIGLSNSYEDALWGMAPHELLRFLQYTNILASALCLLVASLSWLGKLAFGHLDQVVLLAYLAALSFILLLVEIVAITTPEQQRLVPYNNLMARIRDQMGFLFHPWGKAWYVLLLTTMCWGMHGGWLLSFLIGSLWFLSAIGWFYAAVRYRQELPRLMGSIDETFRAETQRRRQRQQQQQQRGPYPYSSGTNANALDSSSRFSISTWQAFLTGSGSGSNETNVARQSRSWVLGSFRRNGNRTNNNHRNYYDAVPSHTYSGDSNDDDDDDGYEDFYRTANHGRIHPTEQSSLL